MYRYCSVSPREGKCIHLYSDTLVRYIGIQHTYTSMKPNETAIHQMYRTSIQLYIFPHMVTEPQYRDTVIQRDTARYSDTAIQRDTPIHMYHHPSGLHVTSPRQSSLANILGRPTKCSECSPSVQSVRHARTVGAAAPTHPLCRCAGLLFPPR